MISRIATIVEPQQNLTINKSCSNEQQTAISGSIKRIVSLDNSSTNKKMPSIDSKIESTNKQTNLTQQASTSSNKQDRKKSSKDYSTVLTVSNLIATHSGDDSLNKSSLISLNSNTSNASTSSESTILILQNTDLINENAFRITSTSLPKKTEQKEKE